MQRGRSLGAQALMIALVLIGLGFGYSFAREVVQAQRLANQGEVSRQANEALAAGNRKLARDLQYYQSDAYAEMRARTDLNMRLPNEQIVLPVLTDTLTPPAASVAGSPTGASQAADQATTRNPTMLAARPWDRWLALFGTGR